MPTSTDFHIATETDEVGHRGREGVTGHRYPTSPVSQPSADPQHRASRALLSAPPDGTSDRRAA